MRAVLHQRLPPNPSQTVFFFFFLTGESWYTGADETSCCFVAEARRVELRQRPVNEDIRALEAAAAVLAGVLLTLVYIHLAVVSLVPCTSGAEEP